MMKTKIFALFLIAALAAGCAPAPTLAPDIQPTPIPEEKPTPDNSTDMSVAKSTKARITEPQISSSDLEALVQGNTEFALALYQQLRSQDGNLIYSPYSISQALAMTYAGARGETESQMASALHFKLPQASLHPAFNALSLELDKRAAADAEGAFRLRIANALWGQKDFAFLPEFLDTLAENYAAGLQLLNFVVDPETARGIINQWISEQTEEKIKDLLPQGSITPDTRLVLTNAIYFKAAWSNQFSPSATQDEPFSLLDGSQVQVKMMHNDGRYNYAAGQGYRVVELSYAGHEVAMTILVPDNGTFEEFEASLDAAKLESILSGLNSTQVLLGLPKFEFEATFGLSDALSALGMPVAFSEDADFTGMSTADELMISDVIHKAFIAVDEEGTEAAAATAVIVGTTSMPADPISMTVDSPFIFLIRDTTTGAILFAGRVTNPAQ